MWRIRKIDGLRLAIGRLTDLVANLLESRFKADKQLSPHEYSGLEVEATLWEDVYVEVKIRPIGWPKNVAIAATFHRRDRHGKDWNWSFGDGRVEISRSEENDNPLFVDFCAMRDASGRIVLGRRTLSLATLLSEVDFLERSPHSVG